VETAIAGQMSEVVDPVLDLEERRNRFASEHLRRVFGQI